MTALEHALRNRMGTGYARWLCLLASATVVAVGGLGGASWPDVGRLLDSTGYWIVGALSLCWGFAAWIWLKRHGASLWSLLGWRGLAAVLCAWGFLVTRERAEFQILMDEPLLVDSSLGMHVRRSASSPVSVAEIGCTREYVGTYLDKRPLVFPLLLSLVHDLLGYRVENVFLLNRTLLLLLLALGWICGRRLDKDLGGPLMLLWFCGWPLLAQNASGGGFEVLNLLLVSLVLVAAMSYRAEHSPTNEVFLLASCLLLANTRYESVLYLGVFALLWLERVIRRKEGSLSWFTAFSPLFLLPYLWQRSAILSKMDRWELRDMGTDHVFGADFVLDNLWRAGRFFLLPNRDLAGSALLGGLGLVALMLLGAVLVRGCRSSARNRFRDEWGALAVVLLMVGASFAVLLFFFYGRLDNRVTSRLALPLILAMGWALCALRPVVLRARAVRWLLPAAMGLWILGYVLPSMNEHRYTADNLQMQTFRWAKGVIDQTHCRKPLVIALQQRIWAAYRYAARDFDSAKQAWSQIAYLRESGAADEVFVVQTVIGAGPDAEKRILAGHEMPDGVTLELVAEQAFYPFNYIRVSRITKIDPDRANNCPSVPVERLGINEGLSREQVEDLRQSLP